MRKFSLFCLSLPIYLATAIICLSIFNLKFEQSLTSVKTTLWVSFLSAFLFFVFICKFKPIYVFGHELAHWIFAKLFLRDTGKFQINKDGGSVEVKNPNLWITLAPYFYPTFTIFWLPFWFLASHLQPTYPQAIHIFLAVLAITWAYHIAMTLFTLKFAQSDLLLYGKPLSYSIIAIINISVIYLFLSWITLGLPNGLLILKNTAINHFQTILNLLRS